MPMKCAWFTTAETAIS